MDGIKTGVLVLVMYVETYSASVETVCLLESDMKALNMALRITTFMECVIDNNRYFEGTDTALTMATWA